MSEKQKQMYNLKCCGDILIDTLMKNGFKAAFTGEYPWQKCYNATHQSTRLDAEEVEYKNMFGMNMLTIEVKT